MGEKASSEKARKSFVNSSQAPKNDNAQLLQEDSTVSVSDSMFMSSWLGHVLIACLICLILLLIVVVFLCCHYLKHKKEDDQQLKRDKYLEENVESKPKDIAPSNDESDSTKKQHNQDTVIDLQHIDQATEKVDNNMDSMNNQNQTDNSDDKTSENLVKKIGQQMEKQNISKKEACKNIIDDMK